MAVDHHHEFASNNGLIQLEQTSSKSLKHYHYHEHHLLSLDFFAKEKAARTSEDTSRPGEEAPHSLKSASLTVLNLENRLALQVGLQHCQVVVRQVVLQLARESASDSATAVCQCFVNTELLVNPCQTSHMLESTLCNHIQIISCSADIQLQQELITGLLQLHEKFKTLNKGCCAGELKASTCFSIVLT